MRWRELREASAFGLESEQQHEWKTPPARSLRPRAFRNYNYSSIDSTPATNLSASSPRNEPTMLITASEKL